MSESIDGILERSGLKLTDAERERLIRLYPAIRELVAKLRIRELEAGTVEPAPTFRA